MKVGKILSNTGTSYQPSLFFRKLFTPLSFCLSEAEEKGKAKLIAAEFFFQDKAGGSLSL